jgi:hypothetical protein
MECIYGIHMLDIFNGVPPQIEEHQMVGFANFIKRNNINACHSVMSLILSFVVFNFNEHLILCSHCCCYMMLSFFQNCVFLGNKVLNTDWCREYSLEISEHFWPCVELYACVWQNEIKVDVGRGVKWTEVTHDHVSRWILVLLLFNCSFYYQIIYDVSVKIFWSMWVWLEMLNIDECAVSFYDIEIHFPV